MTSYYGYNPYLPLESVNYLIVSRSFNSYYNFLISLQIFSKSAFFSFAQEENEIAGTNRMTNVLNLVVYRGHYYFED